MFNMILGAADSKLVLPNCASISVLISRVRPSFPAHFSASNDTQTSLLKFVPGQFDSRCINHYRRITFEQKLSLLRRAHVGCRYLAFTSRCRRLKCQHRRQQRLGAALGVPLSFHQRSL
jgi:hypothetical protein